MKLLIWVVWIIALSILYTALGITTWWIVGLSGAATMQIISRAMWPRERDEQ